MARKNRTPEENARREKIRELLQMANIGSMEDIQGLFKETIAEFMENGLEAELDDELGYSRYDYKNKDTDNSRNGHSSKTLRTSFGDVEVSVPRDRKGEFEPKVLKKNQTSISQDIEEKILSMYAKGMTTGDIEEHIQDIYGVEVSDTTVSRITDKILPIAKEWQQRPLESVYAVVFLDAIHYLSGPLRKYFPRIGHPRTDFICATSPANRWHSPANALRRAELFRRAMHA